jgi:mRNA interferase MazF
VVEREYIPDAGDIVWVNFNPQAGHEQAGRRPAVILSPTMYNDKTSLAVMCPITSRPKKYMFEVEVGQSGPIRGVILTDHLRSLDWRHRRVQWAGRVSASVLKEVRHAIATLLDIDTTE